MHEHTDHEVLMPEGHACFFWGVIDFSRQVAAAPSVAAWLVSLNASSKPRALRAHDADEAEIRAGLRLGLVRDDVDSEGRVALAGAAVNIDGASW